MHRYIIFPDEIVRVLEINGIFQYETDAVSHPESLSLSLSRLPLLCSIRYSLLNLN